MMSLHFDEFQTGDGTKNFSGGLEDLVGSSKVTGIVVGDHFIDGSGES
jgi:hypothetical protein